MLWVLDGAGIDHPIDRLLAVYLADYAGDNGEGVYPAVGRLVERSGISRATVFRQLERLQQQGVLERIGRRDDTQTIEYRLLVPTRGSQAETRGSQPGHSGGLTRETSGGLTRETQTKDVTHYQLEPARKRANGQGKRGSAADRGRAVTAAESGRSARGREAIRLVRELCPEFDTNGQLDDYAVWAATMLLFQAAHEPLTADRIRAERATLLPPEHNEGTR